ncbi:MAG: hypothetical protein IJZ70_09785 [Bacteroidales bacterium]|nr:hypothetical protein [Bacteroidales bacterium]
MDIKDLNIFRFRLFNIKLFGNNRFGLYKEISINEITEFISDFHDFCNRKNETPSEDTQSTASFKVNSNFKILERLCEQYYVYEDTDRFQKKIVQEVREIVDELRNDSTAQKELEDWLNATQDNVAAKLRSTHPELKEEEIRLFCYIQAGFTPTMISVLLRKDKSVVYNRVSRLKSKIK